MNLANILTLIVFIAGNIILLSCKKEDSDEIVSSEPSWELIWADEFNGPNIDETKWYIQDTPKDITSRTARPENLRIEDGVLTMELRLENHNGMEFTGAEIASQDFHLYGKFECRAKLPTASRAWAAFWTLGDFGIYGAWPTCGEVDILEYWGYDAPTNHTNIHTGYSNWQNNVDRPNHSANYIQNDTAFHTYTMEWYEDHLDFFFDGEKYWSYSKMDDSIQKWPFDQPMQTLLLMVAAPGWNGSDADLPATFEIDYVRIYQLVE